ncbi:MAG: CRISPR-associated endonuclease Cas2 [Propionibacterium sp.]|nr:MAG: CRISPR-associated endonuclease Cas2 [Propionibacterium sp.]
MARQRYLIAYDIADPHRLREIMIILEGYGERLQYSVFLCDLTRAELALWERDVRNVIELKEDSVVVINLGQPDNDLIYSIGVPRVLPYTGPTII